jgi:hypothetical protein
MVDLNNTNKRSNDEELWVTLPATEKENYLNFHKNAYEDDLKHAEKNILEFPRWSIISGYYCMHNITKLFLAEKFNIKMSSPNIHVKTIIVLEQLIADKNTKIKLLELLKEAKDIYYSAERLKERTLPTLLRRGKEERGKTQYYTEEYDSKNKTNPKKASYFLETIVIPYIKLIRGLMK